MRLNLGAGTHPIDGYESVDINDGKHAFPLDYPDNSADEIYASHILEHFSHNITADVLADWVRVLKPGGLLRVSVPNLSWIFNHRHVGKANDTIPLLFGGQQDEQDIHLAAFDDDSLHKAMCDAGVDTIVPFDSFTDDASSLPVSLNLQGAKPQAAARRTTEPGAFRIEGVCSVPALGYQGNFQSALMACKCLGIGFRTHMGAFWDQCIERSIMVVLAREDCDAILTMDYDSVFQVSDVQRLIALMIQHPEVDAIAACQMASGRDGPLMGVPGPDGMNRRVLDRQELDTGLLAVNHAHFGLTLIRTEAIRSLPHPWFHSTPNPHTGEWDDQRTDADIHFWRIFTAAGYKVSVATAIPIAHEVNMLCWPDQNLEPLYQRPSEYWEQIQDTKDGKPEGVITCASS